MKKRNLIIVITIILASIVTYQALTLAEKFDPDERKASDGVNLPEYLTLDFEVETYNLSSHVFFGEVTRKESRKVGDNSSYDVFTYITVQVERYDKGEGENEVVVRYEGGTVGNTGYTAIYSPHGIVSLIIGQKAIFFTNKVEGEENLYYTYYVKKTTGFPDVRIDVVPEYSYVLELNSEPHLVKSGNCYYTIDITMLNNGMSDINVKLENVKICDITYPNMTVDERGYEIIPDYTEYVLVPVNSTQSIRYVTGEVVHGSIFYVRIEFTLHIYELDKIEIVSTWLHRKLITS